MSIATLYVNAKHKRKENFGYFSSSIWLKNGRVPLESSGQAESESTTEINLKALIHGLTTALETPELEHLTVISDFSLVEKFSDGTVDKWVNEGWMKTKTKPIPLANLWQELLLLIGQTEVTFATAKNSDARLKRNNTLLTAERKKPGKPDKSDDVPAVEVSSIQERVQSATVPSEDVEAVIAPATQKGLNIDEELLSECDKLLKDLGLNTEVAVTMFLKQFLRKKELELDLKLD